MTARAVLVVGGGIAGLALAGHLADAGVDTVVAERADRWRPLGAGIVMGPNAIASLERLGVDGDLPGLGSRIDRALVTDADGRVIASSDLAAMRGDVGPTVGVHRAALHDVLLRSATGADIRLGTSVESVDSDGDGVDVVFTDGRRSRFDLVVGADGIRSAVRRLAVGEHEPRPAGYICWRFVGDSVATDGSMVEMWGRGRRWGVVPIGDSRSYAFATANLSDARVAAAVRDGSGQAQLETMRALFGGFAEPVPTLLRHLRNDQIITGPVEELPRAVWRRGRTVLIGDAAHAITPNLGQGAAMALEDSAELASLIVDAPRIDAELLETFEDRRAERIALIGRRSRRLGRIGQLEGRFPRTIRDLVIRLTPDSVADAATRSVVSVPWTERARQVSAT